jgi:threonine synthase
VYSGARTPRLTRQFSFEDVVLKGLAADGGLFIPEEIPVLPSDWATKWHNLSFEDLAYEIFSLYISPSEIPAADLKDIIRRSYATFRAKDVAPTVTLDKDKNIQGCGIAVLGQPLRVFPHP